MSIKRLVSSLTLTVLLGFSHNFAQGRFQLGADFPTISFPSGDVPFRNAIGFGMRFPYGVTDRLSVGANISGARHTIKDGVLALKKTNSTDSSSSPRWTLGWVMVDAKYLLGDSAFIQPFVVGELGLGFLIANFDNMISGLGIGGGFGLEHFVDRRWSLQSTLLFRYSYLSDATIVGESARLSNPISETAISLNLGVTYHFD